MSNNSNSSGSEMEAKDANPNIEEEEKHAPEAPADTGEESVDQLKQTIADYQTNLTQIEDLIKENQNDPTKIAELELLRKEIQDAIAYSTDLIKLKESDQGKIKVSNKTLTEKDKGKVCEAFFDTEKQWFAGTITNVNVEQQTAEIDWIGYTEKSTVPAKYIKVAKHPDASQLAEGYFCESLYLQDGCWYPCMIERIFEDGYLVRFKKFGNKETVPLEYLRLKPEDVKKNKEKEKEGLDNFVKPEKLKYKPTDTEEQKLAKKKKLKALKANHKRKIIEKSNKDKQESWLNFQHKGSRSGKGYFQAAKPQKDSIFKTPDTIEGKVGVVRSGMGMSAEYHKRKHLDLLDKADDKKYREPKRSKHE